MAYNRTEKVIEKQEQRRKNIIKAAKSILAEEGMGKFSVKTIARKAGIATGTFYLYFTDKEALFDNLIEEAYEELLNIIKEERAKYTNNFDKLKASMEVCIQLFLKEKHLAKILLQHLPRFNSSFDSKYTAFEDKLIQYVKIDLDELLNEGLITEQNTLVSATAFVGTFRQVILTWIRDGEPKDFEKAYNTLIHYNMRGIGRANCLPKDKEG